MGPFHHGDSGLLSRWASCFWEVMNAKADYWTGPCKQLTEKLDQGKILYSLLLS